MLKNCKHRYIFINTCLGFISCFILLNPLPLYAESHSECSDFNPLTFGVLPFVSAEKLVTRFSPLMNYLSKQLDVPVRIETAPDFIEFARRTNQDRHYDILFTAPHFYPQANREAGYQLLVSVDSPGMWAVIVAPKKSSIYTLNDLLGKRLATVGPAALATLLVRNHLMDAGFDLDKDIHIISTPSHNASLLSSYHGVTDASSLMSPPYEAASIKIKENMRVITKTKTTPHIPISVSARINPSCAAKIKNVLLNMNTTTEGKIALKSNRFSGFKQANSKDYEKLSTLLTK